MANTYSRITFQIIFAVKHREALIEDTFGEILHRYISGVVSNHNQKLLAINSVSDHIHILLGLEPSIRLSDLVREIKSESSRFINANNYSRRRFYWQTGYGVFSYGHSQRPTVINYIMNQKEHHTRVSFRNEYQRFLEAFEIKFEKKYLFEFFD